MKGIYQFAGFPAEIQSVYGFIHKQCRDYRYDGVQKNIISINTTVEDIEHEREKTGEMSMTDRVIAESLSNEYLESLAVYRKLCDALSGHGCLLIHGIAVSAYGGAYLFIDKSEKDKIPLSKLQLDIFGKRAAIVNCGRPLIKLSGDSVYAYGSPWCGKDVLKKNSPLPLLAICVFGDEDNDTVRRLSVSEIYADILRTCYYPFSSAQLACTVSTLELVLRKIGLYSLGRRAEPAAAIAEYQKSKNCSYKSSKTDAV